MWRVGEAVELTGQWFKPMLKFSVQEARQYRRQEAKISRRLKESFGLITAGSWNGPLSGRNITRYVPEIVSWDVPLSALSCYGVFRLHRKLVCLTGFLQPPIIHRLTTRSAKTDPFFRHLQTVVIKWLTYRHAGSDLDYRVSAATSSMTSSPVFARRFKPHAACHPTGQNRRRPLSEQWQMSGFLMRVVGICWTLPLESAK